MRRINSLDTISSRTSLAVEDGNQSSLNEARRQRMLRELGGTSYLCVDSINSYVNRDSDRSARSLGLLLEAQLEVERRLRAEAIKLAEVIKKAWEEAEAKTRVRIAFRVQAEPKAPDEAEARLEIEREAREEAERGAEKMIDAAGRAHAEAITQALAEMMARVQAEQQAITEKRVRAVVEYLAKDETVELVNRKRGVLYKVFFHSRNRLAH